MGADELSPSALLCAFGDRAVKDDREANGRFVPPTSRGKAAMLEGMVQVARDNAVGEQAVRKADASYQKVA